MRCIIFGHQFRTLRGAGQFAGQEFMVCDECGKTVPLPGQPMPTAPVALEAPATPRIKNWGQNAGRLTVSRARAARSPNRPMASGG